MLQHQLVKLRRMYRAIMRDYVGIDIKQSVSHVADRRWEHHVEVVIEPDPDIPSETEPAVFTMIIPYVRYGGRWHQGKLQSIVDGQRDEDMEDEIGDVLARLLSERGRVSTGDLTSQLGGDSHGTRSNSVETRRATVIRN